VAAAVAAASALALAGVLATDEPRLAAVPVLLLAPAILLITDLLPRSLAQAGRLLLPDRARFLVQRMLAFATTPLGLVEAAGARLADGPGDHPVPAIGPTLRELLRRDRPGEETPISSPQVIRRIVEFRERRVRDVMVPLVHIYAVRDDAPIEEALNLVVREKVSRVPVFQQRMYNIVGIVHAFDLLGERRLDAPVATIMRPPLYVPEQRLAHHQLRLMQRRGVNMAVVVDEYGGTTGIVTVEDLLEEIVGEIEDEYDAGEVLYHVEPGGAVRVEGQMQVARLNELFPWSLPPGEYETIAGLVVAHVGRIPRAGVRARVGTVTIEVSRADARAVREVIVRPVTPE
jgi:CBS domain containing-hemolysin-like protein